MKLWNNGKCTHAVFMDVFHVRSQLEVTKILQQNHRHSYSSSFYRPDALLDTQPTSSKHYRLSSSRNLGSTHHLVLTSQVLLLHTKLLLLKSCNLLHINCNAILSTSVLNFLKLVTNKRSKYFDKKRLTGGPGGRNLYHWIPGVGFPISVP